MSIIDFTFRNNSIADPRYYQIVILLSLLVYGCFALSFDVDITHIMLVLSSALLVQFMLSKFVSIPFDYRSPLITALSLCLLLRTEYLQIAVLAAFIAIASKFIIRYRGKHIFNPANLAISVLVFFTDMAWISPAQWGNAVLIAFFLACAGMFVIHKASTMDVTIAFLSAYIALIFGWAFYLGDSLTIPLHQLQNGGLLLFAFFMISDPKTVPNNKITRIIYAIIVASVAFYIQYFLYIAGGIIYSLTLCSILVPMFNTNFISKHY